jgi:pantoate--beta-alanine ligase
VKRISDLRSLKEIVATWKETGETIAAVPTMGALHEGHLSLVRSAKRSASKTIVTLFVNPAQFNNSTDLELYPRNEGQDAALLEKEGADLLFAPPVEVVYPEGFSSKVSVGGVSEGLCGAFRPGHFDGVATVVAKLLLMTGADKAIFGEKDYQQLHVVRRLVRDLNINSEIIGHPTVREADGLALSSRNQRLSPSQREIAPKLALSLTTAAENIACGQPASTVLAYAKRNLEDSGFDSVEYLEMRSEEDLRPLNEPTEPARLLVAAFLGDIRLIDNVSVPSFAGQTTCPK